MATLRENAKTKEILERLIQYTFTHFKHERSYAGVWLSQLAAHKAVHDHMRQQTLDLRENIGLVMGRDLLRSSRTGGPITSRRKTNNMPRTWRCRPLSFTKPHFGRES